MASPRTRRVLQDLKQSNENSVSESGFIISLLHILCYLIICCDEKQQSPSNCSMLYINVAWLAFEYVVLEYIANYTTLMFF